ncbi:hypothetical protein HXX76_015348 [Chlamydomonas incerta]|uniref:Uncharacterized protein n=1 Tax=Chlamydomonas incerta TaxID=51695 RepID=A0A835S9V4_CHLIN|nr:hypothetical protein HXX76_015348 [Chlamydomonas incerta]|eukprot:KAG2423382.1 hypothetical protein HXX76_015348 [Chlamydomonas incerta]
MGSFTSLLARFRRCTSLRIHFTKADDDDDIQHPSLLAAWFVAGMGANVARNITELSLDGPLDLPTLTTVALVLAGTMRHVHTLKLNTDPCGAGGFRNFFALYSALRGAFPALQELCLPAMACLRGLEAFAGSALHTVHVMWGSPGRLRPGHVRSLLQLPQVWTTIDAYEGIPAAGVEGLALGDATLLNKALRERGEVAVQELWALRQLLTTPPPALESLRLPGHLNEVNFMGGRITRAGASGFASQHRSLRFAAAALLPRLEATGQRLPLFKVECLMESPAGAISLLQPHTTLARLMANKCDRVELGRLALRVGRASVRLGTEAAAPTAAALQAVARAMGGGLPDRLVVRGPSWDCTLQMRPRCQRGRGGGDRVAAADGRGGGDGRGTDGAATAAPATRMELTAEQVLERAVDKMWAAASVQGAASMAEAVMHDYLAAGDAQERNSLYGKW